MSLHVPKFSTYGSPTPNTWGALSPNADAKRRSGCNGLHKGKESRRAVVLLWFEVWWTLNVGVEQGTKIWRNTKRPALTFPCAGFDVPVKDGN